MFIDLTQYADAIFRFYPFRNVIIYPIIFCNKIDPSIQVPFLSTKINTNLLVFRLILISFFRGKHTDVPQPFTSDHYSNHSCKRLAYMYKKMRAKFYSWR